MHLALKFLAVSTLAFAGFAVRADVGVDFFRALAVDNDRTVTQLLGKGFDPNTLDPQGQVPLYLAMREGNFKVATALLAQPKIDIDAANHAGETPLMMAALRGHLEWAQHLIERGAKINRSGWTALHYAASGPEVKVAKLLLERGAQIDAPSPNHTTALMMAARYGSDETTALLLAQGANVLWRNDAGLNAADFARLGGREYLAKQLDLAAK